MSQELLKHEFTTWRQDKGMLLELPRPQPRNLLGHIERAWGGGGGDQEHCQGNENRFGPTKRALALDH